MFAIVLVDWSLYLQHRLFHWVPWLWRLHVVHHSDTEFNLTTGIRFHPGEMLISMTIKAATVLALGAPRWVVLMFESLLSAVSLFTHTAHRAAEAAVRRAVYRDQSIVSSSGRVVE